MEIQHEMQHQFASALFQPAGAIPLAVRGAASAVAESRFNVHRNNVAVSLNEALGARFPVVRKLIGEDNFRAIARLYTFREPPRSPVLLQYGATFGEFLRGLGSAASFSYLADMAELEFARGRAYHAEDITPLSRAAFSTLRPVQLAQIGVTLHPSVALLQSRFPVVTIWEANQEGWDNILSQWQAEDALIARPHLKVITRRLPIGGYAFLTALSRGRPIVDAAQDALASAPGFALVSNLVLLLDCEIVVKLSDRTRPLPA